LRITLDTTYLLPAMGVAIKGLPRGALLTLLQEGHEITISDISIFELAAKAGKLIAAKNLTTEKASRGITAIIHDERIEIIPVHHTSLLATARAPWVNVFLSGYYTSQNFPDFTMG